MDELSLIRPVEMARVDRTRLEALVEDFGPQGAERLMGRTLEDIAVRLNRIERLWAAREVARLELAGKELSEVTDRMGLIGLASIAGHVNDAAGQGDIAALGAVVNRLIRVGESALMSAWDVEDITL